MSPSTELAPKDLETIRRVLNGEISYSQVIRAAICRPRITKATSGNHHGVDHRLSGSIAMEALG